ARSPMRRRLSKMVDDEVPGQRAEEGGDLLRLADVPAADLLEGDLERLLKDVVDRRRVTARAADEHRHAATEPRDEVALRRRVSRLDSPDEIRGLFRGGVSHRLDSTESVPIPLQREGRPVVGGLPSLLAPNRDLGGPECRGRPKAPREDSFVEML